MWNTWSTRTLPRLRSESIWCITMKLAKRLEILPKLWNNITATSIMSQFIPMLLHPNLLKPPTYTNQMDTMLPAPWVWPTQMKQVARNGKRADGWRRTNRELQLEAQAWSQLRTNKKPLRNTGDALKGQHQKVQEKCPIHSRVYLPRRGQGATGF